MGRASQCLQERKLVAGGEGRGDNTAVETFHSHHRLGLRLTWGVASLLLSTLETVRSAQRYLERMKNNFWI